MTTETREYSLPHQRTEQLSSSIDWHGFVGVDNIDAIFERVKAIVVPGRSFTIVRTDDRGALRPPRVDQGLTLWMGEAFRPPLECRQNEHGAYLSANMGPKLFFDQSPQCNRDRRVSDRVCPSLYPWAEIRQVPLAFLPRSRWAEEDVE